MRNALLSATLLRSFWHRRFATASFLAAEWYKPHTVSSILAILATSHGIFFCYDIPRYIVTLAILVSSHKYRR